MSKPYTEDDLANQLDSDFTWRLRELSDLKAAIARSEATARPVLLRSLVTILYAHWEGHIQFCSRKYFEHVTLRAHRYDRLERQFYINSFLARIDALFLSRASVEASCRLVAEVLDSTNKQFSRINASLIDTRSNLNSHVMRDLCTICSVDFAYFDSKKHFIDVMLLKRRNAIAHGGETFIEVEEVDDLIAEGTSLMRVFKDSLQNKVYLKSYLVAG